VNRQFVIPVALVAIAGVVSAVGVGSHAGQTVVVVGDSLTAQSEAPIGLVLTADGWRPVVDGRSGSSITNRNSIVDWPTRVTELAAVRPAVVVIELGTNDCADCGDDLDAGIDRILAPLRQVRRVVWLTVQDTAVERASDPEGVNEALRRATVRWPNLELLDMKGHFDGHPEWHIADLLHFNAAGSKELADLIRRAIDAPPSPNRVLTPVV
jgi:lysophospholipase L1-like esterase